jgi:DNA-directed RNA polymerase subunit RPC12/RpoP
MGREPRCPYCGERRYVHSFGEVNGTIPPEDGKPIGNGLAENKFSYEVKGYHCDSCDKDFRPKEEVQS